MNDSHVIGTYPPKARKQGILRRMSHVYDMYKMVKAVKKEARRMDKREPILIRENGHEVWTVPQDNAKRKFLKYRKHFGWTVGEAQEILVHCCSKKYGYLIPSASVPDGTAMLISSNDHCDVVQLSDKGWRLIEKSLFIFPTGLWYAWYEENGKVFLSIVAIVVSILVSILGVLVKIAASGDQTTTTSQSQSSHTQTKK